MGEFGSWVFWKRNPVFVLIFHLWENFCHWQFKGHAANIMSICRYAGIYDFIELGQKVCGGSRCSGREERRRGEGDQFGVKMENHDLFLFQMCFRPHMVLVLAYIPRISEVTHDPASQTDMILAVSLRGLSDPPCPWSSGVTSREQQINPMCQTWYDTMFTRALLF